MSMGTSLFQDVNMALARTYWYLIVGILGLLLTIRAANFVQRKIRSVGKCTAKVHLVCEGVNSC